MISFAPMIEASKPRLGLLAATVWLLASTPPAPAHIVPVADMIRGIHMTQAQCAALPSTVWVRAMGREYCMRYYLSTAGGQGSRPVLFLQGDRLGRLNLRTGQFALGPRVKDLDTDHFERFAHSLSRQTRTTAIYLARPGVDGSSGDHRIRHTVLELHVTNAAVEAIKRRHGFDGFHMIGQSGGSLLVGGMLTLRDDVGCAVIGSGRLASDRLRRRSHDPAKDYLDVAAAVAQIAQRRATRIMVVTDPADRKVPEYAQTGFVQRLRQAGGRVEQFMVQALDPDRHGVVAYARSAATGCLRNAGTEDVARHLQRLLERRLAAKRNAPPSPQAVAIPPAGQDRSPGPSAANASASPR